MANSVDSVTESRPVLCIHGKPIGEHCLCREEVPPMPAAKPPDAIPLNATEIASLKVIYGGHPKLPPTDDILRLLATIDAVTRERDDLQAASRANAADIQKVISDLAADHHYCCPHRPGAGMGGHNNSFCTACVEEACRRVVAKRDEVIASLSTDVRVTAERFQVEAERAGRLERERDELRGKREANGALRTREEILDALAIAQRERDDFRNKYVEANDELGDTEEKLAAAEREVAELRRDLLDVCALYDRDAQIRDTRVERIRQRSALLGGKEGG